MSEFAPIDEDGEERGRSLLQHEQLLRSFFRRQLRDAEQADDSVQEVFARVLAATDPQNKIENWRGFLLRVASNLVVERFRRDRVRQRHNQVALDEAAELASDPSFAPDRILAARERLAEIERVLHELPPVRRQVFVLARYEGWSYAEIADRLGIDRRDVARHVERALRRLVRKVTDE